MSKELFKKRKLVKNIMPAILVSVAVWVTTPAFTANLPEIRGLNIDPVSMQDNSVAKTSSLPYTIENKKPDNDRTIVNSEDSAILKGGIVELTTYVNKSQLIRFDEPVKRMSLTNPGLADLVLLSPREMLLNGKTTGQTSLIIWGEKSNDPVFFDLTVKADPTMLLNTIRAIMPDEKINLKFADQSVILSGKISSSLRRDKIKNLVTTYGFKFVDLSESQTPQVVLEVKVAEASRAFTRNLSSTFSQGNTNKFGVIPGSNPAHALGFNGTEQGIQFYKLARHNFAFELSAGEQKGMVKILAEPKLVSTNGNKASFNAGQQLPVPTSIDQNGNVAYDYKDIGVNVEFTPTISEETGRILLNIKPEVSEIDTTTTVAKTDKTVIYGFKTRKADTTVDLQDGQTLIIAGLLQKNDSTTKTQIPIVGDIPLIGRLFGSSVAKKGETELIIFVTPKIIDPRNKVDGV